MAKVKRSVLKEIVKECLLEILFEGIDSEPGYAEEEPIREARQSRRTSRPSRNRNLAAVVQETRKSKGLAKQQRKEKDSSRLQENAVNAAVSELTSDPLMASIFADTAQTTLQEQREGRKPPADNAAAVVENTTDLENIFEGAGNWAAIAFSDGES